MVRIRVEERARAHRRRWCRVRSGRMRASSSSPSRPRAHGVVRGGTGWGKGMREGERARQRRRVVGVIVRTRGGRRGEGVTSLLRGR